MTPAAPHSLSPTKKRQTMLLFGIVLGFVVVLLTLLFLRSSALSRDETGARAPGTLQPTVSPSAPAR